MCRFPAIRGSGTRPDIVFAVGRLSKFMQNPGKAHWNAALQVVRYLKTTRLFRLTLGGKSLSITLTGMTDLDFAACIDTRRSVSGYAFTLGSGAISWKSRQQDLVTLSTCKAEFVAACEATRKAVFTRNLLGKIGYAQDNSTLILADNQGAIVLTSDQTNHTRTKHIDFRYRYVQERTEDGTVNFEYVRSCNNVADIFTKALP
jgi:hypothetical protein